MKLQNILQIGDPLLRQKSEPVPITDINSNKIADLISQMKMVLSATTDGVALAAPQIGKLLRIFVVSEKAFGKPGEDVLQTEKLVYINPELQKVATKKVEMEEGCLSVHGKFGKIKRSSRATVVAYDENGVKFRRGASGLLAEIFQHEIDHLNGILFVDTAWDIKEVPIKTNDAA